MKPFLYLQNKNKKKKNLLLSASDLRLENHEIHSSHEDEPGNPPPYREIHFAYPASLREATKSFQRQHILRAVEKQANNWAAASRELGVNRSNLHNLAQASFHFS